MTIAPSCRHLRAAITVFAMVQVHASSTLPALNALPYRVPPLLRRTSPISATASVAASIKVSPPVKSGMGALLARANYHALTTPLVRNHITAHPAAVFPMSPTVPRAEPMVIARAVIA